MSIFGSIFDDSPSESVSPAIPLKENLFGVVSKEAKTVPKIDMPENKPVIETSLKAPSLAEVLRRKQQAHSVTYVDKQQEDIFLKAKSDPQKQDDQQDDSVKAGAELKTIFQESIYDYLPFVGAIIRTCPFDKKLLPDESIKALKKHLDEFGVPEIMPQVYAARLKHNIEKGYVQPDGSGFTDKGQERASSYLIARGYDVEQAKKRVQKAKALKHDPEKKEILKAGKMPDLKFGFGYRLDEKGKMVKH